MSVHLKDGIDSVGYVDWGVRDFHGYQTDRGSTYNAYLVRDEKTALIDTVKAPYACDLLREVTTLVALDAIDFIVCNHAEPDHSGALPAVVKACPNAEVVCNKKCKETLERHFDTSQWRFRVIAGGDSLSLGKRSLNFINTPMTHWPESMFTYVPEEKLLFSMDAFGQHYACSGRFDDQEPLDVIMHEAKKYYANILMPYGKQVAKVVAGAAKLDIDMIAPSHGIVWRSNIPTIVREYMDWVVCRPKAKVLVLYDTMWQSTEQMAHAILEGAQREGIEAQLHNIRRSNLTRMATEILDAAAVAFGSPTLNRTMMPEMAALLTYMKGLRPTGKVGLAFGSFGWAKGGGRDVDTALREMSFDMLSEPLQVQYAPTAETLEECREAGRLLSDRALALSASQ